MVLILNAFWEEGETERESGFFLFLIDDANLSVNCYAVYKLVSS